jgi:hypothetical protein
MRITFDAGVSSFDASFVGVVRGVRDEEAWLTDDGYKARVLDVEVTRVFRGPFEIGLIPVVQFDVPGPQARIEATDIGDVVLMVGEEFDHALAADGSRSHERVFSPWNAGTYIQVDQPGGEPVGVRLCSPFARHEEPFDRGMVEQRLAAGLQPGFAEPDVVAWSRLLAHAQTPAVERGDQIGANELPLLPASSSSI